MRLAALADAGAFLGGPQHTAGVGKTKHGLVLRLGCLRQDSQEGIHRRRFDDLARIEDALRVERPLDPRQEFVACVAHHRADELATQPTVTVLAAQTPPIFADERGHIGGHVAKHLEAGSRVEIKEWSEMQFARSRVSVVDAVDPILLGEQPVELRDVGG